MWDEIVNEPVRPSGNIRSGYTPVQKPNTIAVDKKPFKYQNTVKIWKEANIDASKVEIYLPIGVSVNNDAPDLTNEFQILAERFNKESLTVRVDGSGPASDFFEKNAIKSEVHLPWKSFNEKESKYCYNPADAYYLAKRYSPNYESIKEGARHFLARNVRIVLGKNLLSPILFLICWSKDGCEHARNRTAATGYAGLPIAIASVLRVPVFNLANPGTVDRILAYLD